MYKNVLRGVFSFLVVLGLIANPVPAKAVQPEEAEVLLKVFGFNGTFIAKEVIKRGYRPGSWITYYVFRGSSGLIYLESGALEAMARRLAQLALRAPAVEAVEAAATGVCTSVSATITIVATGTVTGVLVGDRALNGNWLWEQENLGLGVESLVLGDDFENSLFNNVPTGTTVACDTLNDSFDATYDTFHACTRVYDDFVVKDSTVEIIDSYPYPTTVFYQAITCGDVWSKPESEFHQSCRDLRGACLRKTEDICGKATVIDAAAMQQLASDTEFEAAIVMEWGNGQSTEGTLENPPQKPFGYDDYCADVSANEVALQESFDALLETTYAEAALEEVVSDLLDNSDTEAALGEIVDELLETTADECITTLEENTF